MVQLDLGSLEIRKYLRIAPPTPPNAWILPTTPKPIEPVCIGHIVSYLHSFISGLLLELSWLRGIYSGTRKLLNLNEFGPKRGQTQRKSKGTSKEHIVNFLYIMIVVSCLVVFCWPTCAVAPMITTVAAAKRIGSSSWGFDSKKVRGAKASHKKSK